MPSLFFLHLGLIENLQTHLDSFVSFTTDFGTEAGLTEYRSSNVTGLLPTWIRRPPPPLELDIEEDLAELELDLEIGDDVVTDPTQSAHSSMQVCLWWCK